MRRLIQALLLPLSLIASGAAQPAEAAESDALVAWNALREGGHVVLMRHAQTEAGIGDPPGFALEDCRTQRNLSADGRKDARQIGQAFRDRGINVSQVRSSRWCRCLDTARLAFATVEPEPALDSMFREEASRGKHKLDALKAIIAGRPAHGNLVLVTHSQNIIALTGVSLGSGEMLVVKPLAAGLQQVGVIAVPRSR
ncbi:MAG TPA: histidine phosphatase family protein [Noviherbaspirillum sp.]|jgi:phosphohistidine phosphatase SixA|uniref:histidine phosphatase family protein n=1 Tax=Noviherbaspirillum sp. TaxID=1926288 RepID=UPI002F956D3A